MKRAFWLAVTLILTISMLFSGCQRSQIKDDADVSEDIEEQGRMIEDDTNISSTPEPLSTATPSDDPGEDEQASADAVLGAIRVMDNYVSVYRETSTSSEIIDVVENNNIFAMLDEKLDADNKTWYLIECNFGRRGWIPGWLCEETEEKVPLFNTFKSEKGALLNPEIDKDLYVRALLMEEYSVEAFEREFGRNNVQKSYGPIVYYEYPNGFYFLLNGDGEFYGFGFGDRYDDIRPSTINRITCDIFSNPGDELLIFFEYGVYYRLLVCDADTREILREYNLDFLGLDPVEIGDFLNIGGPQLYLDGHSDGEYKKGIYRIVNDDFVEVIHVRSFDKYNDHIQAALDGSNLSVTVDIGSYHKTLTSLLPDKVFYDTRDVQDKNGLLTVSSDWSVVKKDGKWFIQICSKVNYPMVYYYWGPPGEDIESNDILYNDLARVFFDLSLKGDQQEVIRVSAEVKYDNPELLKVEPLGYDEIRLVDGLEVEMSMESAYEALGGNPEEFEYSDYMEYNGVSLFEFCGSVVEITVKSPDYETPRGLRVGDTIDKVESLYGKPDNGFSGDEYVMYKHTGSDFVNYYRGLDIHYKDGAVEWFCLYQVILD